MISACVKRIRFKRSEVEAQETDDILKIMESPPANIYKIVSILVMINYDRMQRIIAMNLILWL